VEIESKKSVTYSAYARPIIDWPTNCGSSRRDDIITREDVYDFLVMKETSKDIIELKSLPILSLVLIILLPVLSAIKIVK
jgi:hypothetical protein